MISLGLLGMGLSWWFSTTTKHVSEVPHSVNEMPSTIDPVAVPPPQNTENEVFDFESVLGFKDAVELNQGEQPLISVFHSMFTDEDRAAMDAEAKRAYEIVASGEYFDFLATKPTTEESDRWWAERGFFYDPNRFKEAFREYFPTGEPEAYESEMREEYAMLFEGVTAENETNLVLENAHKFIQDPRNQAWIKGYFNRPGIDRDDTFTAWTSSIRDDLINGASSEGTNSGEYFPADTPPQDDLNDFLNANQEEQTNLLNADGITEAVENSTATHSPEEIQNPLESPEIVNFESLDSLGIPELPTDESIEAQLQERLNSQNFSPRRLSTAMQTINRYGPQEGLRRLKESDPEIAKVLERNIGKQQEN